MRFNSVVCAPAARTIAPLSYFQSLIRLCAHHNPRARMPLCSVRMRAHRYAGCDIIFLQEAAASFIQEATESPLGAAFFIITPTHVDGVRNQNSLIFLSRAKFSEYCEVCARVFCVFLVQRCSRRLSALRASSRGGAGTTTTVHPRSSDGRRQLTQCYTGHIFFTPVMMLGCR